MASKKRKRIFIVDDDVNHTQMLRSSIEKKFDFEVIVFNNGEDCVKNLHLSPTFVVLDYSIGSKKEDALTGTSVLKQIKMVTPGVYVIMLSAADKTEELIDAMKYGAYDYVAKNPSGFIRVENILININYNLTLKRRADAYKTATIILSAIIVLIIIMAIILIKTGAASKNL